MTGGEVLDDEVDVGRIQGVVIFIFMVLFMGETNSP